MKKSILGLFLLLIISSCVVAQPSGLSVGLDLTNMPLGSAELKFEYPLHNAVILRAGIGGRKQASAQGGTSIIPFLKDYNNIVNQNVGASIGLTFADHYARSYPYLGIDLNGVYVNDTYKDENEKTRAFKGYTGGVMVGIGFVLPLTSRLNLDFCGKIGYTKPLKDERKEYFLPVAGYTLSGTNESISQKFITFMPSLTLKYTLKPFSPKKIIPTHEENSVMKDLEAKLN